MSDELPPSSYASDQPCNRHLQPSGFRPRFWVTLGEIVGVLALVVAGLSYWDTHRERVTADRERTAEERQAAAGRAFAMTARSESSGDRLVLQPIHADQPIQSQTFFFPTAVRGDPVQTTGDGRIEANWIAHGLDKARARAHLKPEAGDARLPVGIVTTYLSDGETRTDRALYDIGYGAEPRFLREPRIRLGGLSFVGRAGQGDLRARVDALWLRRTGQGAPPANAPPD